MDFTGRQGEELVEVEFCKDKVKFICPSSNIKNRTTLSNGDRRDVKWIDSFYYPAIIKKIRLDGLVDVVFTQDRSKLQVSYQEIKNSCELQVGDVRDVKWTDGFYYKARILHLCKSKLAAESSPHKEKDIQAKQDIGGIGKEDNVEIPSMPLSDNPITPEEVDRRDKHEMSSITQAELKDQTMEVISSTPRKTVSSHLTTEIGFENKKHDEDEILTSDEDKDLDYIPFSDEESSDSDLGDVPGEELTFSSNEGNNNSVSQSVHENEHDPSDVREVEIDEETPFLVSKTILVAKSKNDTNKRVWDKKFPCLFCKKFVGKLPRHYQQVHSNEKEVLLLMSLTKNDQKKKELLDNLRNSALYIHNTSVLKNKHGTIIPKRRKSEIVSPSKLVPCVRCNAFLSKNLLHRHKKTCSKSTTSPTQIKNYKQHVANTATYMLPTSSIDSYRQLVKSQVIATMREGPEKNIILSDPLIMKFGAEMFEKLSHIPERNYHIRNKLRELGRFVLTIKNMEPKINELNEIFKADHFQLVIDATLKLAGFDINTNEFQIPTLAKKLGESLQKCVAISNKNAILEKDEGKRKDIKDFLELFDVDWNTKVANKALSTLYNAKFNKEKPLPSTDDTKKLATFIELERKICIDGITRDCNAETYSKLLKITLACLIIFNKKRVGDAHNLLLKSYINGLQNCELNMNVMKRLNDTEKSLINSLTRIETRGKKGKKVPILLTPQLKEMMDLLLENRENAGVMPENKRFFAIPGTNSSYYRGSDIIRDIRTKANLKHPERITSTNLRKEAATMAAASGCSDADVDILATFLGHDRSTHQKYYRLPEETLQKAKVGHFLMNVMNYNGSNSSTSNNQKQNGEIMETEEMQIDPSNEPLEVGLDVNLVNNEPLQPKKLHKKRKMSKSRTPWSEKQREVLKKCMEKHFLLKTLPGKMECETFLKTYKHSFNNRSWTDIKYFVKNNLNKKY